MRTTAEVSDCIVSCKLVSPESWAVKCRSFHDKLAQKVNAESFGEGLARTTTTGLLECSGRARNGKREFRGSGEPNAT